jgi:hypothetical protein
MMPVTNPKAWEAVTGFTGNIKAAVERLNKLAGYFPESKDHLIAVAARIEAECVAPRRPNPLPLVTAMLGLALLCRLFVLR